MDNPFLLTILSIILVGLIVIIIVINSSKRKKASILTQIEILTDELDRQKKENISLRNELRMITSLDNLFFSSIIRLTSRTEPAEIAREAVGLLLNYLNATQVAFFFLDEREKRLNIVAQMGLNENWLPKLVYEVGEGKVGMAAEKRIPLGKHESEMLRIKEPYPVFEPDMCYPLVYQNRLFGVIAFKRNEQLDEREKNMVGVVARITATALQNTLSLTIMRDLASIDPLTKLYNIGAFRDKLVEELNRSKRFQHPLSLAIIDLDNFKYFNDTYGHQLGDQILIKLARAFGIHLRETDIIGRYGGDEFIVMFPETKKNEATKIMKDLLDTIRLENFLNIQSEKKITFSAGVASYPEDGINPSEIIKNADEALYEAKNAGRNQVRMHLHKVEEI
uniref:GGDEF domain-containing protein n=1 Tax=candidate division WOR-3 bacterium TaxID=2052148 RepID=A0A7C4TCP0_UNCW3